MYVRFHSSSSQGETFRFKARESVLLSLADEVSSPFPSVVTLLYVFGFMPVSWSVWSLSRKEKEEEEEDEKGGGSRFLTRGRDFPTRTCVHSSARWIFFLFSHLRL